MPSSIGPAQQPASSWTLRETLDAMGFEKARGRGEIKLDDDGWVSLSMGDNPLFEGYIENRSDFDKLMSALSTRYPRLGQIAEKSGGVVPHRLFTMSRASHFENHQNDRWFRNQDYATALKPEYRNGQAFSLPTRLVPNEKVRFVYASRDREKMEKIIEGLSRGENVAVPTHPQEMGGKNVVRGEDLGVVRNASSDRTLHYVSEDGVHVLIKVPLEKTFHDGILRPISADDAERSVRMSAFLKNWLSNNPVPGDCFAILSEFGAMTEQDGHSVIFRSPVAFPPLEGEQESYTLPVFSLWSGNKHHPDNAELLIQLVESRPSEYKSPIDYFRARVLEPLIKSVMRVYLDLGAAHVPHGQNLRVEMGGDGHPTGRFVHADLESFWPHPALAEAQNRPDFYAREGYDYIECFESNLFETFKDYLCEGVLPKLIQVFSDYYGEDHKDRLVFIATNTIRTEIHKREALVADFADGPLKEFDEIRRGDLDLSEIIGYFIDGMVDVKETQL